MSPQIFLRPLLWHVPVFNVVPRPLQTLVVRDTRVFLSLPSSFRIVPWLSLQSASPNSLSQSASPPFRLQFLYGWLPCGLYRSQASAPVCRLFLVLVRHPNFPSNGKFSIRPGRQIFANALSFLRSRFWFLVRCVLHFYTHCFLACEMSLVRMMLSVRQMAPPLSMKYLYHSPGLITSPLF